MLPRSREHPMPRPQRSQPAGFSNQLSSQEESPPSTTPLSRMADIAIASTPPRLHIRNLLEPTPPLPRRPDSTGHPPVKRSHRSSVLISSIIALSPRISVPFAAFAASDTILLYTPRVSVPAALVPSIGRDGRVFRMAVRPSAFPPRVFIVVWLLVLAAAAGRRRFHHGRFKGRRCWGFDDLRVNP